MDRKLGTPVRGISTDEEADEITRLEDAADARFEEERVGLRWPRASLDVVRAAAQLAGVPYQTYVKQATFRQALTDLKDAEAIGLTVATTPALSPQPIANGASSASLEKRIAKLKSRPFKHPEARRIIDEWERLRENGGEIEYGELARSCGNAARQGFGQTMVTVERAARALFGTTLFEREERRNQDGEKVTMYRANPAISWSAQARRPASYAIQR
jgi:hypothetical protein